MGFGAPGFATSASGGPIRLLFDSFAQLCLNFTEGNSGSGNGAQSNKPKSEEQAAKSKKVRDMDSSELEGTFHVGASGTYKDVLKNHREFSRGPGNPGHKGVVEADHMPPKDSLKKAAEEPLIWILGESEKFEGLLKMLQKKDPKGRDLFTLQVLTGQHRTALTTGNSRESVAVRAVLANAFATGQVVSALKLTFLVSHPISSMELREQAGIQRDHPEERFGRDRTMRIYSDGFLKMIDFFFGRNIIDMEELVELCEHITDHYDVDGDFKRDSFEYKLLIDAIEESKK
ncbi:uncharacterized protein LOC130382578 [Gadus chalcogrammus]|uniref:uncharacterized protein LOC130382578 n=1 Tax=Gadus chalcogrammus TaxID=1042646 RepID=UPI0024C394B0|nr:uncharacterized protein LOC130382578 [Gadus chalcogrammus]